MSKCQIIAKAVAYLHVTSSQMPARYATASGEERIKMRALRIHAEGPWESPDGDTSTDEAIQLLWKL